jgi:hypothetical protein
VGPTKSRSRRNSGHTTSSTAPRQTLPLLCKRSGAVMNTFQTVFEQQQRHFASGVTRSYEWRVEQLDRMARLTVNQVNIHLFVESIVGRRLEQKTRKLVSESL